MDVRRTPLDDRRTSLALSRMHRMCQALNAVPRVPMAHYHRLAEGKECDCFHMIHLDFHASKRLVSSWLSMAASRFHECELKKVTRCVA